MNLITWMPVFLLATSFLTGIGILLLGEERAAARTALNLAGAVLKVLLVLWMLVEVSSGTRFETRLVLMPGVELILFSDKLTMLFSTLSAALWLVTTLYAIGYLRGTAHQRRFFGFFSLCVTATMGVALSGNLITFLIFYEMLTLSTWPLIIHAGSDEARRAGRVYLAYTLTGGAVLFVGVVWLGVLTGPVEFVQRGVLAGRDISPDAARWVFALLVGGVAVKAALVPLHQWLPTAMVAPAPVSALLHAVAVVKAGAFGIVRIVYDVYGAEYAQSLGLLTPLGVVAAITILYASVQALAQQNLKRRLAYSTVSQISYIALGTALVGPIATTGALVHLVHQGLMKITLFFCAGAFDTRAHVRGVRDMAGLGRGMPWTSAAFTVGALGMVGVPPIAGFVTKWYLAVGRRRGGGGLGPRGAGREHAAQRGVLPAPAQGDLVRAPRAPGGDGRGPLAGPASGGTRAGHRGALPGGGTLRGQPRQPAAVGPANRLRGVLPMSADVGWLLLDARFGVDATSLPFGLLTLILWTLAAVFGRGYLAHDARRRRFAWAFGAAFAGNLFAVLAQDAATFYVAYGLMSFSTWALVVHDGGSGPARAGRVYIAMVVLSEALLLAGVAGLVAHAQTHTFSGIQAALERGGAEVFLGLWLAGLGVKAGTLGLHVWLPLAHAFAPTPASAVLSGAMLKVGILGWLRVLPGVRPDGATPAWSEVLLVLGFAGIFFGALWGLAQERPKAVLAYSSVSQLGFITVAVALLGRADASVTGLPTVQVYAVHHALVKGALFLGTGLALCAGLGPRARTAVWVGLVVLALALSGAPLTGGALAKAMLKGEPLPTVLTTLLSLGAVGTVGLMARYLWMLRRAVRPTHDVGLGWMVAGWSALTLVALTLPWLWAPGSVMKKLFDAEGLWSATWPVLVGAVLAVAAVRGGLVMPRLPLGDLAGVLEWGARQGTKGAVALARVARSLAEAGRRWVSAAETWAQAASPRFFGGGLRAVVELRRPLRRAGAGLLRRAGVGLTLSAIAAGGTLPRVMGRLGAWAVLAVLFVGCQCPARLTAHPDAGGPGQFRLCVHPGEPDRCSPADELDFGLVGDVAPAERGVRIENIGTRPMRLEAATLSPHPEGFELLTEALAPLPTPRALGVGTALVVMVRVPARSVAGPLPEAALRLGFGNAEPEEVTVPIRGAWSGCPDGFAACAPGGACETNIHDDVGNCGGCGVVCNLANVQAACVKGRCAMVGECADGFGDCDGRTPTGCETPLTTVDNCGGCASEGPGVRLRAAVRHRRVRGPRLSADLRGGPRRLRRDPDGAPGRRVRDGADLVARALRRVRRGVRAGERHRDLRGGRLPHRAMPRGPRQLRRAGPHRLRGLLARRSRALRRLRLRLRGQAPQRAGGLLRGRVRVRGLQAGLRGFGRRCVRARLQRLRVRVHADRRRGRSRPAGRRRRGRGLRRRGRPGGAGGVPPARGRGGPRQRLAHGGEPRGGGGAGGPARAWAGPHRRGAVPGGGAAGGAGGRGALRRLRGQRVPQAPARGHRRARAFDRRAALDRAVARGNRGPGGRGGGRRHRAGRVVRGGCRGRKRQLAAAAAPCDLGWRRGAPAFALAGGGRRWRGRGRRTFTRGLGGAARRRRGGSGRRGDPARRRRAALGGCAAVRGRHAHWHALLPARTGGAAVRPLGRQRLHGAVTRSALSLFAGHSES